MTIAEGAEAGKRVPTGQNGTFAAIPKTIPKDLLFVVLLVLASTGSFGLGVIAGREGHVGEVFIERRAAAPAAVVSPQENEPLATGGQYVASRNGTKYYLPWCGTAKRIKEENKVWFASKEEAVAAGYEPGKNCKGI